MVLMIVGDFYVVGVSIFPAKADAPLLVNADAVLAFAVAGQCFQLVAGRKPKIVEALCAVKLIELHNRPADDLRGEAFWALALKYPCRLFAFEALDHWLENYLFQ